MRQPHYAEKFRLAVQRYAARQNRDAGIHGPATGSCGT
jgi:hypothetical protein